MSSTLKIIHGDCLDVLRTLEPESFDAVITDPPYCSGGMTVSSRIKSSGVKYCKDTIGAFDFAGESRDQRLWMQWCREWLKLCRKMLKTGGLFLTFIDWRQYPAMADLLMENDYTWRGVVVWDKKNVRPQPNQFRAQCEFILWASKGAVKQRADDVYLNGLYTHQTIQTHNKLHQTEKPVALMRDLLQIVPSNSRILDPFAGSGSTLVAAHEMGMSAVGIEIDEHYAQVARDRIANLPATT